MATTKRTAVQLAEFRAALVKYETLKWPIFPCKPGTKEPRDSGWQEKSYAASDFKDNDNVGIKVSSDWVDLDLDQHAAIQAADSLFPNEGGIYGRAGKRRSHRLRRGSGDELLYKKFLDIGSDDKPLLELRALAKTTKKVKVTILPPSIHEGTGEIYEWEVGCGPDDVPAVDNIRSMSDAMTIAFAALLGKYWPSQGNRHDLASHVAGMLRRMGVAADAIKQLMPVVLAIGKDPEVKDRMTFVNTTLDMLAADPKARITGAPSVAAVMGEDVVKRLKEYANHEDDDIDHMNDVHFFTTLGTTSVIGREDKLDGPDGQVMFQRPKELQSEYANRLAYVGDDKNGNPIYKPLFEAWLKSVRRRDRSRVVFMPPPLKEASNEFNLWRGFNVKPTESTPVTPDELLAFTRGDYVPGRCFRILHHLRHVIANDDPAYNEVILNWIAAMVLRPADVAGTAHVWIGEEGTGKNLGVSAISKLFHPSMVFSGASDLVVGKFNACTRNRVFFNVNESDGKKLKKNFDRLKMIITEPMTYLEPKGVDAFAIQNFAHILFTTNGDEDGNVSLPSQPGQRRIVYQQVNNRYATGRCSEAERRAYFGPLLAELNDERSLGAFLWLLQHRDLSDYDPYAKLVTDEEVRQRGLTMTSPIRWLWDLVALGKMPHVLGRNEGRDDLLAGDDPTPVSFVYECYADWAKQHNETPVGVAPWGKAVNTFLWRSTRRTNAERLGVLVTIEELEKRLHATSDPKRGEIEVTWSDGRRVTLPAAALDDDQ